MLQEALIPPHFLFEIRRLPVDGDRRRPFFHPRWPRIRKKVLHYVDSFEIWGKLNSSENFPGHYRRITTEAWYLLVDMYGVEGPAIAVYGEPVDDKTRWGIFKDPRHIDKVCYI